MKINELLKKIRQENGYTLEFMSKRLKVSQPFLSNVENSKKKVSKELYEKMLDAFPTYKNQIEKAYLDTQDINFNSVLLKERSNVEKNEYTNFIQIPLYGMASAGNGYINQNEEIELITLPVINGNVKKTNFAAKVNGDSMEPDFKNGDIIVIDTDIDFDIRALNGKEAMVDVGEERYLKKIQFEKGTGDLTLISYNPAYPDIKIPNYELDVVKVTGIITMVVSMRNNFRI
jgi:putative lexA repressor|nr:MAG TPA: Repressor protein CI [Caudoviricetes sp.]